MIELLRLESENHDKASQMLSEFIKLLSAFHFSPKPEDIPVQSITLSLQFAREEWHPEKILYLVHRDLKNRRKGWTKWKLYNLLRYLNTTNAPSKFAAKPVRVETGHINEAYSPTFITGVHSVFSKADPVLHEIPAEKSAKLNVNIDTLTQNTMLPVATALYALTSGMDRASVALRQISAQWLAYELYHSKHTEYLTLLKALICEAYTWIPTMVKRKRAILGSEYHYAIASKGFEEIAEKIEMDACYEWLESTLKLMCKKIEEKPIDKIEGKSILQYLKETVRIVKETIKASTKTEIKHETLIGRLPILLENVEKWKDSIYENLYMIISEQTGPAMLRTIADQLKISRLILFYTPLTLTNRLILDEYLNTTNWDKEVIFIPLSDSNPGTSKQIIRETFKKYREGYAIAQGPMTLALPLYLQSKRTNKTEEYTLFA